MNEVVVISPDKLHEIIKEAVASAVGSAIATIQEKTPKEMNDFEAAEYLGVKVATMRSWRNQKKGPKYHKSGRAVRYARKDLDIWLSQSEIQAIDSLEAGRGISC